MDPNTSPQTSYVDPYQSGYQAPNQPVSKRSKIIVIVMILAILTVVITGIFIITSQKDPSVQGMEAIVATNAEIVRVSELMMDNPVATTKGLDVAATAMAVSRSSQATATKIITEDLNSSIDKKSVSAGRDQSNDDKLKQGELLGNIDKTYYEILKKLLTQANSNIELVNSKEEVEAKLAEMAKSNELIFNSIPKTN